MGAARLYTNCLQNAGLRPLFKEPITLETKRLQKMMGIHTKDIIACGIENYMPPTAGQYDEKFVAYLILKYRTTYSKIIEFWDFCEKAFRWVIKYPHEVAAYPTRLNKAKLIFYNENGTVFIKWFYK